MNSAYIRSARGSRLPGALSRAPDIPLQPTMRDTGYGSAIFLGVDRIAKACRQIPSRSPLAAWRRLRAGSLLLVWYRHRLPVVTVPLTRSGPGRMIGEHLAIRQGRRLRFRSAQAVLELPADFSDYLRGRRRQAVRTNVGHARRAGLTVVSYAVDNWFPGTGDSRAADISPGPVERWMVTDADGLVVADSIVSIDEEVALLQGMISFTTHARWLLHTAIVERLCGSCSMLLVNCDDAYELAAGTQYFQQLLGYEIARLRVPRPSGGDIGNSLHPAALRWPPDGPQSAIGWMSAGAPEPDESIDDALTEIAA
jgi:hypothetical protein